MVDNARRSQSRVQDVYERTMKRVYKRKHHKGKQLLRFGTALVSATRSGSRTELRP